MIETRREFLGQTIGTVIATGAPFIAAKANGYRGHCDDLTGIERMVRLLRAPLREKRRCRILLKATDGLIISGPTIQHVTQPDLLNLVVEGYPVKMLRRFTLDSYILLNGDGELVRESQIVGGQLLLPEDTLYSLLSYKVTW